MPGDAQRVVDRDVACPARGRPSRARGRPSRAAADADEDLVALEHRAVLEGQRTAPFRSTRGRRAPTRTSTPCARAPSCTSSVANSSSRASSRGTALDERHLRAERRPGLAESPRRRRHRRGRAVGGTVRRRCFAVRPGVRLGEPRDRRDERPVPVAMTTACRARGTSPPTSSVRSPVSRARAAQKRHAALLEPRQLHRVVEVVDDFVAAAQRRRDVELAGRCLRCARDAARLVERLRGTQQRLRRHAGVVRALAADELAARRSRRTGRSRPGGRRTPRRPGRRRSRSRRTPHRSVRVRPRADVVRVQHLDRVGQIR